MNDIDKNHFAKGACEFGQWQVMEHAAAEDQGLAILGATPHSPENYGSATIDMVAPVLPAAPGAAADADRFSHIAHCAHGARAGGEEPIEEVAKHEMNLAVKGTKRT
jgi:hypothetical protein